jgi:threonine/homoserine/homoserine lactone efflux protein
MNERQTKILETLEGMKLARKNVIPYIINIIGAISALTLMYFGYQGLRNQGEEIRSETKTTNELLSPSTSRSGTYNPFTTDTLR